MNEDIHRVHRLGDVCRWNQTGEDEAVGEIHRGDASLKIGPKQAITDPQVAQVWESSAKLGRQIQQIVVSFEMKEPRDRANGDVFGSEAKLPANILARH